MANEVTSSDDLSAGSEPSQEAAKKVEELLSDAASRRRYRGISVTLTLMVVVFLCYLLSRIACAVTFDIAHFSPWIVGIFATVVVAISVLTIALMRATFAPPNIESDSEKSNKDSLPQLSAVSEALKAIGGAIESLGKTVGKS